MKHFFFVLLIMCFSFNLFSKEKIKDLKYNETYRSQYHYSTENNRLGGAIAITAIDSVLHLYYQYNATNTKEGFVSWGHSSSSNLLKWDEHNVAISAQLESDSMNNTPWWGSVVKTNNGLTAWVSYWNNGIYKIESQDGFTWGTPVKTTGTEKLLKCEPYVFWHEATQKWIMMVYDRDTKKMSILNSSNGNNWQQASSFNYNFGFPQFFELPVDRKTDDTRWILLTEKGTYLTGKFDGENFEILTSVQQFNYGKHIGASATFFNERLNKMLLISEVKNDPQNDVAINSQFTVCNEITLHKTDSGTELRLKPISALNNQLTKTKRIESKKIYPGINNNIINGLKGEAVCIKAEVELINCDQFGFLLRSNKSREGIEINYNINRNKLSLLGTNIDYTPVNKTINIEILIDRSIIEVYIDGGKYVVSSSVTPDPLNIRHELFTMGGEVLVKWIETSHVTSVWNPNE